MCEQEKVRSCIAIVVGHTYTSKGAAGVYPILPEYDFNSEIAQLAYQYGKSQGLEIKIFLRDGIGIKGVYRMVKDWVRDDKAVAVELHFNAFNGKARGTETLYDNDPAVSKDFAKVIHQEICQVFKRKDKTDRGIKLISNPSERGYTNLNECKIPSVISEPFFGDNKEEAELAYGLKKQYAQAIVNASVNFLNSLKN